MGKVNIFQAKTAADTAAVRLLFVEYLKALEIDYNNEVGCVDGHADMQNFPRNYKALFLAKLADEPVAACGIKRVNGKDCELVRLYCRPEGRGQNLGRKLSEAAQAYVKADGCARLVLSTEPIMEHAVRLYKDMGFVDIENYADAPSACSKYMALKL
jgi:ribosomal protein S18 acetylase RimI-like enzyme